MAITRAARNKVNNEPLEIDGPITMPHDAQRTMRAPSNSLKKRRYNAISQKSSQRVQKRPNPANQPTSQENTHPPLVFNPLGVKQEVLLSSSNLYSMSAVEDDESPISLSLFDATCATASVTIPNNIPQPTQPSKTTKERAQKILLEREAEYISNKATERSYTRHVNSYVAWWEADQLERAAEALRTGVPDTPDMAHPITAEKVVLFLNYEFERTKKSSSGDGIANTKVGISSIKQAISALDWCRRRNHREPEYQASADSQRSLREDPDVRRMEEMASAREPKRLDKSQEEKAKGVLSKTFTEGELVRMSVDLLCKTKFQTNSSKSKPNTPGTKPKAASKKTINKALRNKCMLIFSTTMALRGDDTRPILLSDIQVKDVPIIDVGLDNLTTTLIVRSNEGKTNTTGRIDQHPTFRHRNPDLCAISALAYHLFARFHIVYPTVPDFTPKFIENGEARAGPYGYRDWYSLMLFPSTVSLYSPMSAENHRKQFNEQKADMELEHRQVTHVGRSWSASVAMQRGATSDSVRALGLWSQPGSFDVYVQSLPTDAMVALAGFNGKQPGSYFIARDVLDPPNVLLLTVFPWIEQEEQALCERVIKDKRSIDAQLTQLLSLLRFCRRVLLQDAAIQYSRHPDAPIFKYHPFNSTAFQEFSASATAIVQSAEDEYKQSLLNLNLPERTVEGVRGLMETNQIRQHNFLQELRADNVYLRQQIIHQDQKLNAFVTVAAQTALPHKRKRLEDILEDSAALQPQPPMKSVRFLDPSLSAAAPAAVPAISSLEPCSSPLVSTAEWPQEEFVPFESSVTTTHLPPSPSVLSSPLIPSPYPLNTTLRANAPITQPGINVVAPAWSGGDGPPIASGSGRLYPWKMFPICPDSDAKLRANQMKALTSLEEKIGADNLKRLNHRFEWNETEWLPDFPGYFMPGVQVSPSFEDIWREQVDGMDGRLSIQKLKEIWQTQWRRGNGGIKTEGTRRNKLIKLIENISAQRAWPAEKVLQFLDDQYPLSPKSSHPHLRTSRSFIEYLQKGGKAVETEIMEASTSYKGL